MAKPDLKDIREYRPGNPPAPGSTPEQIVAAVWDELNRIAAGMVLPPEATPQTPAERIAQRGNG